jgi:DNA modification methylase
VLPDLTGVDLFFTSPPYNLGTTNGGASGMHAGSLAAADLAGGYTSYDDARPQHVYDAWQSLVVASMWQALSDNGAIFYNHKPRVQGGRVIMPTEYGRGLPLRQIVIWDRGTGMNFSESFFLPKSEWIVVWAKDGWRLIDRKVSELGDVWRIPPERAGDHPAPFPLGLPMRAITATAAAVVCDPFAGSGTTLRAAKDCGRRAVGIELDERYCEMAAKRCAQGVLDLGGAA